MNRALRVLKPVADTEVVALGGTTEALTRLQVQAAVEIPKGGL